MSEGGAIIIIPLISILSPKVMKLEDLLDRVRAENAKLQKQAEHDAGELLRLAERSQQQELDLTIVQEKHRTCQREVAGRDQTILRLQADLDTAQQRYQGTMEEVSGGNDIKTGL